MSDSGGSDWMGKAVAMMFGVFAIVAAVGLIVAMIVSLVKYIIAQIVYLFQITLTFIGYVLIGTALFILILIGIFFIAVWFRQYLAALQLSKFELAFNARRWTIRSLKVELRNIYRQVGHHKAQLAASNFPWILSPLFMDRIDLLEEKAKIVRLRMEKMGATEEEMEYEDERALGAAVGWSGVTISETEGQRRARIRAEVAQEREEDAQSITNGVPWDRLSDEKKEELRRLRNFWDEELERRLNDRP